MKEKDNKKTNLKVKFLQACKEIKFVIVFTIVFVLFSDFIFESYNSFVIEPILSKANKSLLADLIALVYFLFMFFSIKKKIKKGYYVKLSQVFFCLIILSIYIYFRVTESDLFLSFETVEWIKYFDILFFSFTIPIILKVFSYFKQIEQQTTGSNRLLIDNSILNSEEDVLGRNSKALKIYKEIIQLKSEKSTAFGIVGAWGSGKTSFLNLIKEKFNKSNSKKNIVVDFNPWLNISIDSIVQDYFNTLEFELKEYSVDISKNIKKYGDSVLNLHNNSFTNSLLKGSNLMFETNLTSEYERLNELLKKLNKRIIIFIDDFDRLQANEIFEILKLIRNTVGFDSFTYIVAYDREYLVKSLEKHNIPNPEKFSEKIFLKELELLPVTSSQINLYLSKELLKSFEDKSKEINDLLENNRYSRFGEVNKITKSLKNLRDVKRFINSFLIDYEEIKNEVQFRDYFILKLLKFKYYNIYTLFFSHRDDFVTKENYNSTFSKRGKYILKPEGKSNNSFNTTFKDSKIQKFITENFSYDKDDLKNISSLISNLFDKSSSRKDNLSISYEINYYKYFRDELSLTQLSIVEFKKVMSLEFEDIKNQMTDWFKEGKFENAQYYLSDTKVYDLKDVNEYEKYIKSMFFMANFDGADIYGRKSKFGFDYDIIWYNLNNEDYGVIEEFYNNKPEELGLFLKSILDSAESPYGIESLFCYHIDDRIEFSSKIIKKETVRKYLVDYFKEYSQSVNKTDDYFWTLFRNCYVKNWKNTIGSSWTKNEAYLDEAKLIFKDFIANNLDNTLFIFIQFQSSYGRKSKKNKEKDNLVLDGLSKSVFGTCQGFLDFLKLQKIKNSNDNSEFLNEFTEFVEKYIKNDEKPIEFNFTHYKINEKLYGV